MILLYEAIRDLIAHLLPHRIASFILPKADYVFLIYLLNLKDAKIKYPFAKYLPDKLIDMGYSLLAYNRRFYHWFAF